MLPTTDCNEWPSNDCIIIVLHCWSLSAHTEAAWPLCTARREAGAAQWWSDPGPGHTAAQRYTDTTTSRLHTYPWQYLPQQ